MADSVDINANASAPAKAMRDGHIVEQHPLTSQIEADRYLASKAASRRTGKGWRALLSRLVPGGSTGSSDD